MFCAGRWIDWWVITFKPPSWFIHKPRSLFYTLINGICLTTSFVATQSSIHPSIRKKSWTWLDSCDCQIFLIEKDLFSTLRWNNFRLRANRLWVRAKWLWVNRTLGEMTCFHTKDYLKHNMLIQTYIFTEALEALLNRIQVDIEVDSNLKSLQKGSLVCHLSSKYI